MPHALPEIREADAPPVIAAIYADIKAAAALPQVNLIFRYIATIPGALEWVWQALRPLYRSSELATAATDLTRSIERPGPSPLAAALTGEDKAQCRIVLNSYNSGNPQNLIALTALVHALNHPTSAPAHALPQLTERRDAPNTSAEPFPSLPTREQLKPKTLAIVQTMADRHKSAPGVIPSMYLHLALWPPALEAANIYLQPVIESPGWSALVATVIDQAGETARELAPAIILAGNAPAPDVLAEIRGTIETFINNTIPDLITVGALLALD